MRGSVRERGETALLKGQAFHVSDEPLPLSLSIIETWLGSQGGRGRERKSGGERPFKSLAEHRILGNFVNLFRGRSGACVQCR